MDAKLIRPAIEVILLEMQKRLDNAASVAAAAAACARANQIEKAVEIALDVGRRPMKQAACWMRQAF